MIYALLIATALAQSAGPGGYYTEDEAKQLFAQGNDAYEKADYDAAMSAWQKLVDHGYGGQDVLYNLGTAALKKGDLGRAVLYLERARELGPAGDDLTANLEAARARQGDQVIGGAGEDFVQRVARATPRDLAGWTFLVTWVGGALMVLLFRLLRPGRRTLVGVLAGVLLTLAVPSALLLGAHVYVSETVTEGVVLAPTLQARELPTPASNVLFEIHAGLKVRVLESEGRFVRIRLPNGRLGWTEKEGIAEI